MRFAAAALVLSAIPAAAGAATPITGRWLTGNGNAIVAVAPCGRQVCGHVERVLKSPAGSPGTDANNPDPALRNRPIVGVAILSGFADAGGDWRGRIYNPEDGKSYKSIVSRESDGTLKVKGCVSFFCRTQVWRPVR